MDEPVRGNAGGIIGIVGGERDIEIAFVRPDVRGDEGKRISPGDTVAERPGNAVGVAGDGGGDKVISVSERCSARIKKN